MLVDLPTILNALDEAESIAVAATLAGLSITAASFLANIAKTHADKTALAKAKREQSQKEAEAEKKPADRQARERVAAIDLEKYSEAKNLSDASASGMKRLVGAFFFFILYLLDCLTLDALIEQDILTDAAGHLSAAYPAWVGADLLASVILLGGGLVLLSLSAKDMLALVPQSD